jgi:hypothetical protein
MMVDSNGNWGYVKAIKKYRASAVSLLTWMG